MGKADRSAPLLLLLGIFNKIVDRRFLWLLTTMFFIA